MAQCIWRGASDDPLNDDLVIESNHRPLPNFSTSLEMGEHRLERFPRVLAMERL